jgi:hypothetical protein
VARKCNVGGEDVVAWYDAAESWVGGGGWVASIMGGGDRGRARVGVNVSIDIADVADMAGSSSRVSGPRAWLEDDGDVWHDRSFIDISLVASLRCLQFASPYDMMTFWRVGRDIRRKYFSYLFTYRNPTYYFCSHTHPSLGSARVYHTYFGDHRNPEGRHTIVRWILPPVLCIGGTTITSGYDRV